MRYFILLLLVGFVFTAQAQKKAVDLKFDTELIELGDVVRGEKETFEFNFTNVGTDVIEIEIISSCVCTTVDWTKGKIAPGEKGKINLIFDSTEKEESETVQVDMYLTNIDPKWDSSYFFPLEYTYNLIKK